MKRMIRKLLVLSIATALILSACLAGVAAAEGGASLSACSALPDCEWQKTASFPDWKGYTDDTLAMNSMLSFEGRHGQGAVWLSVPEQVESFVLYVNGTRFDTSGAAAGVWIADISEAALDGINTLQVSNIRPRDLKEAVTVYIPCPEVLEADRGTEGIRPEALKLVSDIVASDTDYGFPGAQLAVVRHGRLVYENAWGRVNSYNPDGTFRADSAPVTTDTLFDLASLTKMLSVNYALQKLVTDGQLDPDARVVDFLGEAFAEDTLDITCTEVENPPAHEEQIAWKRSLTVRDLLRHQAGFPASPHYNNPDFDMAQQAVTAPGANACYATTREETLAAICKTPLLYQPGTKTVYSDVDYMLLTFVTESVTGKRLDTYMKETFYAPLGLERTTFLPLENGFTKEDCAATELNGNTRDHLISFEGIRTDTVQGEVHDERAWYCMEGVSGHAGLFSTASEVAKLASVMLTGGYGEHRFFSRTVLDLFTAPKALDFGQWGLGWWRQGDDKRVWYFGTQASSGTVGHQGWTCTLVMIDPDRDLVIAYLTNAINSPVTSPDRPSRFDGNAFTASTLGFVPQLLSIGLDSGADVTGQLTELLADMASESMRLIPEGAEATHPNVKNSLSKIDVLREWASDNGLKEYLQLADELEAALPH